MIYSLVVFSRYACETSFSVTVGIFVETSITPIMPFMATATASTRAGVASRCLSLTRLAVAMVTTSLITSSSGFL